MEERRGTEEGEEFKPIRRGWCLGEEKFREELLTQMSERMGAEHYGEERAETAEALAGKGSGKGSVLDIGYFPPSSLRRYKRWFR